MKKIHGVHKILLQFKKSLFVLFNAMAEFVNCSFFLKNLHRHFCNLTYRKNFVKHTENLPQHLSEKCIGNNSLVIDIAKKLRFIGIAQGFLKLSIIGIVQVFLKLSIIVIALVRKGLSCPSQPVKQFQSAKSKIRLCKQTFGPRNKKWSLRN